ncbi:MAG: hypothetical protein KJO73_00275 [Croceitalea sp.]|nr:hypothetical protein [Croceitalea sp.]
MLKFFRQVRQKLLLENRTGKYLKYALGEIVLVVIGILIALQINNWNQNRIEKKIEKHLLQELSENLALNAKKIKTSIAEEYKSIQSVKQVLKVLENQLPYHDSMDYHFGRSQFSPDVVLSSTAFRSIQSRGFDIISSDNLRNAIINLFDDEYGALISETVRLEDQFWPNALLPLYHKHFRIKSMEGNPFNDDLGSAPIDYQALLKDQQYHNMIKHRGAFRYQSADLKKVALEKTVQLNDQIQNYLK